MKIQTVRVEGFRTGRLDAAGIDGLCHTKTLPTLSVVQALEGFYDISVANGEKKTTGEGGFFIAPAHRLQKIVHRTNPDSGRMRARWVFFSLVINDRFTESDLYEFPTLLPQSLIPEMNRLFDGLFAETNPYGTHQLLFAIARLITGIATEPHASPDRFLDPVLRKIRSDYATPVTVSQLASEVNLSVPRFFAVFRKHLGTSPIAYLNSYRLSVATDLLELTDLPIKEISFRVGFPDSNYFNKAFRKAYQLSPTRYRSLRKKSR